jgi:hypothetical protein
VPLDPVPAVVDAIAEFYASGLFLARNNFMSSQVPVLGRDARLIKSSVAIGFGKKH